MLRKLLETPPAALADAVPRAWSAPPAADVSALCAAIDGLLSHTRAECASDAPLAPAVLEGLFTCGLFSLTVPKEADGLGASLRDFTMAMQHVGRLGPAYAMTAVPHLCISVKSFASLCAPAIAEPILRAIRDQQRLLAFAITEDQGSDVSAMKTRLTRGADGVLRLNGRKQWITNLARASHVVVAALCPDLHRAPGAVVLVRVSLQQAGVSASQPWDKLAANGSDTAELFLDDVVIADDAVLGAPGQGMTLFNAMVQPGRLGAAAAAVGMAAEALEQARQGLPTLSARAIHEMDTVLQTLGVCLRLTAAYGDDAHPEFALLVSLAKHLCSREAQALVTRIELAYAAAGSSAPAAVRRASDTMGLFRLLKGPGDVIALQTVSAWASRLGQADRPRLQGPRPLLRAMDWLLDGYALLDRRGGASAHPMAALALAEVSAAWWLLFGSYHADRDGVQPLSPQACRRARRWAWRCFAAAVRRGRSMAELADLEAFDRLYATLRAAAQDGGRFEHAQLGDVAWA